MSEKLYALLLKLYPGTFRRTYGDEALRLVRDRAHSEKGLVSGLRLWLDLLLDLAISLPREYGRESTTPVLASQPSGDHSFELLAEQPLSAGLLCLSGTLSAALLWACVSIAAHSGGFPALFPFPLAPQGQSTSAQDGDSEYESPVRDLAAHFAITGSRARFVSVGAYSVCMIAKRDIPSASVQPLLAFRFTRPGASGVALMDGKVVKRFKNEVRVSIRAHVLAGDHQFVLHLDRPAENTSLSSNANFEYCHTQ